MAKVSVSLDAVLRVAEIAIEKRLDGPLSSGSIEVEFDEDTGAAIIYRCGARGSRIPDEVVPLD